MNPPNNIQNGFFTPVSHFFSKARKLTVFSRNPHTPIIPQSVRLRMDADGSFVPKTRRSASSACPLQFFGNKKNHMPDARGACRAYDWGFDSIFPRSPRPPSSREVWEIRRSRPPALPSIAYRGFAVAPMTLRAPSRNVVVITIQISGCGKYKKRARNARPYGLKASYTTPGAGSQPCSFQRGLWGS